MSLAPLILDIENLSSLLWHEIGAGVIFLSPVRREGYLETRLNLVPLIHCPVAGEATEAHQP